MVRVLFVCLGNICRSPMAEAVFAHKVRAAGLQNEIEVDSAGTGNWHVGEAAHRGTLALLKLKEIEYNGRARQIVRDDLDRFDYIVTMDNDNLRDVQGLARRADVHAHIASLLSYALHLGVEEVPDPWYDGRFQAVYDLVDSATENLLAEIRREHPL